ncbi:TPM domain-containing protein [Mycobacterium sp. NPDC048908]|uniref:TPM domain-containing protein n=1 Tax=Mycobacterium sp. NPDC048908 TaxID=3364292 RepID=UPI00372058B2
MRIARLLGLVVAAMILGALLAPTASGQPPFRLPSYVNDSANALSGSEFSDVQQAVDKLYNEKRIRLWVVYVDAFSGQDAVSWTDATIRASGINADDDAVLAVATVDRAYAFHVPSSFSRSTADELRRNQIEPALRQGDWGAAAIAAAQSLGPPASADISWFGFLVALAVLALAVVVVWLWLRRRKRKRREAEFAAARRVDPTDPSALAAVPLDALDELSKSIVVDVDNAVRTSDNELGLAVEEFGRAETAPFQTAVTNAKTTLAQAFNVRQILDDAVPESAQQRRDLLTRVIVAAAKADRELDARRESFEQLRDLVINAPSRLDTLTQQMVDVTARIGPSEQALATLHNQFSDTALASVAGNVETAKQRLEFADQNITNARTLVARPVGRQTGLVDSIRAAESALGQARTLLDAIDSAGTDITRAVANLPAVVTDIQNGIDQAGTILVQEKTTHAAELSAARDAAVTAVAEAQRTGGADPLGAFTKLTQADAELDRLLANIAEEREATERLSRAFDQALFIAQSRVRGVSDYIDTRRGSIGPEARTRLAEAVRQLQAAQDKRSVNLNEAIANANGASVLAAQAQDLANADVRAAQRSYTGQYGQTSGSNMGAVLGGIIIGNILSGALRGGIGGSMGGGWSSTSFGGSSGSSGGGYTAGGRF